MENKQSEESCSVESGGCCHCHEHEGHKSESRSFTLIKLILAAALTAAAVYIKMPSFISLPIFAAAYLLSGFEVIKNAYKGMFGKRFLDENFLMVTATFGAFLVSEYSEAVAVMIFYGIGGLLQDMAVGSSRKSIASLMDIRPDYANVLRNGEVLKVNPSEVLKGEAIVVRPGEKIPLDGKVLKGESSVDVSALTGEALPKEVLAGSRVLSGSVNKSGLIEIEVTSEFKESTVSKILTLIENSKDKKSKSEQFITKFARVYTPAVVLAALLVIFIPPVFEGFDTFHRWLYNGLTFLIVSCPCALVISIPISFFGGIGGASRQGVLVKGGNYLEALNLADTVIFDKTGTITKGELTVTDIIPKEGVTREELLKTAAIAESSSTHPIALSILSAYKEAIDSSKILSFNEKAGFGVRCVTEKDEIIAGKYAFLLQKGVMAEKISRFGISVYVALNGVYIGAVIISDEIKETAEIAVKSLKSLNKRVIMLTGDNEENAKYVASKVGIDSFKSELLPTDKVTEIEKITNTQKREKTVFVGDGINDAPSLARADIGVAMGGIGSDAAIEAADIVLMTDDPLKLVTAFKVASQTRRIVMQNIVLALSVKGAILTLSLFSITSMWFAVFADVGVALLAVLNALRALRIKNSV